MEEFTIVKKDGRRSVKDLIKLGNEWRDKKLKEGCEKTPDGYLPMIEIKKAGYVMSRWGEWTIPLESYIADGNYDKPAGQKYWGTSKQYLHWKKKREIEDSNRDLMPTTSKFNFKKEKEEEAVLFPIPTKDEVDVDGDIDVSKIPF